jgi:hypothetical protein
MLHLTLETIARLIDDAPNADEAAHLASCDVCRSELDAMRQQTFALTNLGDSKPPRESWSALEKRLEREGLIARESHEASEAHGLVPARIPRKTPWHFNSAPMRAAAAILIFLLGGLAGAWVRGVRANAVTTARPDVQTVAAAPQQGAPVTVSQATTSDNPSVEPVQPSGRAVTNNTSAGVRETGDVSQDVRTAEAAYLQALARYSEQRPASSMLTDPVARLATLESILLTTKAALREAPADPVINGYHLTALAERDAVLKQIAVQQTSNVKLANNTWF